MLAALERPAAVGNGWFAILWIGEGGFSDDAGGCLPDDLLIVSLGRSAGKAGKAPLFEFCFDQHARIDAVLRNDRTELEVCNRNDVQSKTELRLPDVASLGHKLGKGAIDPAESDKSYVVLYHVGSSSWAMRGA
ncbi:hypothetical protein D9M72_581280 [compost metagenome]